MVQVDATQIECREARATHAQPHEFLPCDRPSVESRSQAAPISHGGHVWSMEAIVGFARIDRQSSAAGPEELEDAVEVMRVAVDEHSAVGVRGRGEHAERAWRVECDKQLGEVSVGVLRQRGLAGLEMRAAHVEAK
eukprot:scaffold73065_cov36-Tisochrysis_lutea.AAC.1